MRVRRNPASRAVARSVIISADEFHPMGGTEQQICAIAGGLVELGVPTTVIVRWPTDRDNRYLRELINRDVDVRCSGYRGEGVSVLQRRAYVRARIGPRLRRSHDETERRLWEWQAREVRRLRGPHTVLHEIPFFGVISDSGRQVIRALGMPTVHTVFGEMAGATPVLAVPWASVTSDGCALVVGAHEREWIPSVGRDLLASTPLQIQPAPDVCNVLFAGRLVEQKGVHVLLKAMARLGPQFRLVVAGYGPVLAELEAEVAAQDLPVRFAGQAEDELLASLFAEADLVVQPSLTGEGIPSTVAEALAAGKPVVASDVGGLRLLAELDTSHGASVRLVPPGDPAQLAEALDEMSSAASGVPARALFDRALAPGVVLEQYMRCYEDAVRRRKEWSESETATR